MKRAACPSRASARHAERLREKLTIAPENSGARIDVAPVWPKSRLERALRHAARDWKVVMSRILVLYGTTEGHTGRVANAIRNTLTTGGFDVDVIQAGTIDPSPGDYSGIVVAASVHGGRYQKPVGRWLRRHAREFGARPTAFISVCLGVLQKDPKVTSELDAIMHRFVDPLGWRPTITKPVAGALVYSRYGLLKRWIMKRIAAQAGGDTDTSRDYDYTDWNDLTEFAVDFGRRVGASQEVCEEAALRAAG
jgi:menaquinone-dependent protoporphyrinogen oxidase